MTTGSSYDLFLLDKVVGLVGLGLAIYDSFLLAKPSCLKIITTRE